MADGIQAKAADEKIVSSRGPAYPYINLERAIERAAMIAEKGAARQKMPPETFYRLWNFGAKSSGARQTMAALNYYDLVEYVGRGSDRKVQLTELALRIVLDKQPKSPARKEAIKKAALEPAIFRELHGRYAPILPDDVVIETYLKIERAFNDEAAAATIKNFRDTMTFAGLDEPDGEPDEGDSIGGSDGVGFGAARVGDLIDWETNGVVGNPTPMRVIGVSDDELWVFVAESQTGLPMEQVTVKERPMEPLVAAQLTPPPANPFAVLPTQNVSEFQDAQTSKEGYRSEKFDADEGVITISWPSNLSPQSVEDMQAWVELLMKRIDRRARAGEGLAAKNS